MILLLMACGQLDGEACGCPMPGHGVLDDDGRCLCLPHGPSEDEPEPATTLDVTPDDPPDWDAIDAALAGGHVLVRFATVEWPDRIEVRRADGSEHRLILDGGAGTERAVVPGILTGYDDAVVHRTTVRGFEITGSKDKGVFWNAGDEVVLDDLVVHDNKGTPAINLQYSNRSGRPSSSFTLRNSHVYNQSGECVYIGGSEGEDQPSHERVVLERNLVHDCFLATSTKADGINVKDRIGEVVVRENVVFDVDWGIEVASPGTYAGNLVFRPRRQGFQVGDFFGPVADMHLVDNAVLDAGEDGFRLYAEHHPAGDLVVERATVLGAGDAGVLVGGEHAIEPRLLDVVVTGAKVGFDGWGGGDATVEGCATSGNDTDGQRNLADVACDRAEAPDTSRPAGPDDIFLTADDPWLLDGMGARLLAD